MTQPEPGQVWGVWNTPWKWRHVSHVYADDKAGAWIMYGDDEMGGGLLPLSWWAEWVRSTGAVLIRSRAMDEPEQRTGLHCPIGDHQVLLSFTNDADAQAFREWWGMEGWDRFKAWVEMMSEANPQPGQVWERDGDRREVVRTNSGIVTYRGSNGITWDWFDGWLAWQSGATLVEGETR